METNAAAEAYQYVGPFRLEKTLGKGQTGEFLYICLLDFTCSFAFLAKRND